MPKIRVSILILHLLLFTTIFVPYIDSLKPLHVCLLFLPFPLFFSNINKRYTVFLITMIAAQAAFMIIGATQFISFSSAYTLAPLIFYIFCYSVFHNMAFSEKEIRRTVIIFSSLLALLILIQLLFPGSALSKMLIGSISDKKIYAIEKYGMIMAPLGNPRNAGLVIALFILLMQLVPYNSPRKRYSGFELIILAILILGLVASYGRTVLAALLFIESLLFLNWYGKKSTTFQKIYITFCLLLVVPIGYIYFIKYHLKAVTYYLTTFNFWSDNSFTARYSAWNSVMNLLNTYKIGYMIGIPFYKEALRTLSGYTVIDSSLFYLLISSGALGIIAIIIVVLSAIRHQRQNFYFFSFLFISSITLPFFSDYRIAMFLGLMFGLINSKRTSHIG